MLTDRAEVMYISPMKIVIPSTDRQGLLLVLEHTTKAEIAKHLGIRKQNLTRWKSVPAKYVNQISDLTGLPREYILPSVFK